MTDSLNLTECLTKRINVPFLSVREVRSLSGGQLRKPLLTGSLHQPVMHGAMALSSGK